MKLNPRAGESFAPLAHPARYKGAYGGRGSGKSHFFAEWLVFDHLRHNGLRSVCIREVQKTLKESAKKLIEDKIAAHGLERFGFDIQREQILTPGGGLIVFQGMQDHSAESIKSLEGFGRAWVEEAQTLSERSLMLLRPTIRAPGSELWFSWNPRLPKDPVDKMLRGANPPTSSIVVRANYDTNPWFPKELEQERVDCQRDDPLQYGHIWEGDYQQVFKGAYYSRLLAEAENQGRVEHEEADPLIQIKAFWDIGGTSRKSDATAIWIAQFIGNEARVLDYYEAVGQPFSAHVQWLRDNEYDKAVQYLPHDGGKHDMVHKVTPQSYLRDAGLTVELIENQGPGAAVARINAARRVLPSCRFDADRTKTGREALAWYHEKWDEKRDVGLGPEHDWSSHAADGFGMLCQVFEASRQNSNWGQPIRRRLKGVA